MKLLSVVVLFFIGQTSVAAPYYRFWRGWKLESLSYEQFQSAIDKTFIPATVEVGQGKGLLAYIPALLPTPSNRPTDLAQVLPDEIALVVYRSKSEYQSLRATADGQKYSDLHWEVFDKERGSKSTEPEPFYNNIEINHAYDVLQSEADWQKGHAIYSISRTTGPLVSYVHAAKSALTTMGLKSYLILVAETYVIEFQLWKDDQSFSDARSEIANLRADVLEPLTSIPEVRKSTPYASGIQFDDAVNTQFNF